MFTKHVLFDMDNDNKIFEAYNRKEQSEILSRFKLDISRLKE